jgi:osmotically-inducible protein OsmY
MENIDPVIDVERALASDTRIEHTKVGVSAGIGGIIVIEGQVDTYNEKAVAEDIAGRVRGVKDVVNNITVIPSITKSDAHIAEDVRKNLELDTWVDDKHISAETVGGVVFLRGTTGSAVEKFEAENDARWVAGVIDVVNHLVVKLEMDVADAEVAREVRGALIKNTRLDLTGMEVDVTDGVVTLTGEVANFTQKKIAEYIAFSVQGVVDLLNELHVRGLRRPAA